VSGDEGDGDNPYRFTGGADEPAVTTPTARRRLTLQDLRGISRGRRFLAAFLGLFVGSCLATMATLALAPVSSVHPREEAAYLEFAIGSMVVVWIAMIGLFVVGAKMIPLLGRPFAALAVLGLIVPGLNVVIAVRFLHDAKRTLASRNVRLGWLTDDFSQANADRSFWRPSRL
jgi:hypothetical protein